jgi:hypothetical protein
MFQVDADGNLYRRQLLAGMIEDEADAATSRLPFTVVSEPNEGEDDDDVDEVASDECEDLGTASVDLKEILGKGRDVIDEELPVYDPKTADTIVGHMRISVECVATLQKIKDEMKAATTLQSQLTTASTFDRSKSLA